MYFGLSCLDPLVLLLPKLEIIWLSNLSILSVPYEGYSRNASCALNKIYTFLFENVEVNQTTFQPRTRQPRVNYDIISLM